MRRTKREAAYCASKGALLQLTRAAPMLPEGIRSGGEEIAAGLARKDAAFPLGRVGRRGAILFDRRSPLSTIIWHSTA